VKAKSPYNETFLLQLTAAGDENAFRNIYDNYRDKLYSYALRLTQKESLAEEIVQDAFLKVWMNRAELTQVQKFDSYLYAMVRNQCFNCLKRLAHESILLKELSYSMSEVHNDNEESLIHKDYLQILNLAVNKLPPQQQLVYNLSRNSGLKYDEIATELNLSKNTVKAHLKKALSSIRVVFTAHKTFIGLIVSILLKSS
jgi:RNA polymerase sigma-70 factor (ECF subfamily)